MVVPALWGMMALSSRVDFLLQPKLHLRLDVVAMILANALLACGPMFVRMADVGPVAAAFWRMALALPILFVVNRLVTTDRAPIDRRLILVLAGAGLFFAADLASWHLGIVRTKLANATLFGNSASLIYPIYGFVVARVWPNRRQVLALLLAMAGAALLMGRSYELSRVNLIGDLLCVAAGIFYAGYFVMIARARETMAPVPLLAASTLASAVPLWLAAMAMGERIIATNWWPLIALALCSQLLGQGLMVYVLGRLSPLIVGLGLLVQPAFAALLGWIIFGEGLARTDWIGAALVALALVLVRQGEPKAT